MTIKQALSLGYKKTKSTLDSEVLLSSILKKPKAYLYANPEKKLSGKILSTYLALIKQKTKGVPAAYLTGEKEFFGNKFFVNKHVLVPRPETETLVELVTEFARSCQVSNSNRLKILDIGTGSGNIIISLAKTLYNLSPKTYHLFYASDISAEALQVAKQNTRLHKVRVAFKQGSLLSPWKNQQVDIMVANLPYLAKLEHPSTNFEPKKALLAGKKGLALIEELFRQINRLYVIPAEAGIQNKSSVSGSRIKSGMTQTPIIFLEFDPRQTKQIKNLANKLLPGFEIKIYKDLSGRNRFISLTARREIPSLVRCRELPLFSSL